MSDCPRTSSLSFCFSPSFHPLSMVLNTMLTPPGRNVDLWLKTFSWVLDLNIPTWPLHLMPTKHLKPTMFKTELLAFPTSHSNQSLHHVNQEDSSSKCIQNLASCCHFHCYFFTQATIRAHQDYCNSPQSGLPALSLPLRGLARVSLNHESDHVSSPPKWLWSDSTFHSERKLDLKAFKAWHNPVFFFSALLSRPPFSLHTVATLASLASSVFTFSMRPIQVTSFNKESCSVTQPHYPSLLFSSSPF